MRRVTRSTLFVTVALIGTAHAEPMSAEQLAKTLLALQSRVEALEQSSRRDRAEAEAARAEVRSLRAARAPRAVAPAVYAAPIISKDTPLIVTTEPVTAPFSGFYVAAIGGYGFGSVTQGTGLGTPEPRIAAASGGSVGGAFGYNMLVGTLLLGIEGRGRKEFVGSSDEVEGIFSGFDRAKQKISREYGGDISFRLGMTFEETLGYFRVGGGANQIRSAVRVTRTNSFDGQTLNFSTAREFGSPYFVAALGIEQNFGSWFVRAEGAFLSQYDDQFRSLSYPYYSTEVTGAVGYRF